MYCMKFSFAALMGNMIGEFTKGGKRPKSLG